jgi:hypothetical protein
MRTDWDAEAAAAARYAHDELMSRHRGALAWRREGIYAVFGNDGHGSPKVLAEVAVVRERFAGLGVKILGFGVNPEGTSWAMLVETHHPRAVGVLDATVWEAWEQVWQDHYSGL